ncbi:MAG: patatin-like phospholipase family protein [Bryobacteraceae bacterium]|nr:patatin-like phospholipase family protein [Bryobacteraceae bacterium]
MKRTALVLSAGGMFGAYQAGAWRALSEFWQPDVVIGASVGSLNGWAIAGGCTPAALIDRWLRLTDASTHRFHLPRRFEDGLIVAEPFVQWVREVYDSYQPLRPYGVVITDLLKLKPVMVMTPGITWRHLAASCAVLGMLPQQRIDGRLYTDGGLMGALPLWAAAEAEADVVIGVNVLRNIPRALRTVITGLRSLGPSIPELPPSIRSTVIGPEGYLGDPRDAIYWNRDKASRWIDQGYEDVLRQKHFLKELF